MSVSEYMWKQRQNQYGSLGNSMPHHWAECQNIRMDLIRKCWHLPPMLSEVKRIWFIFACANWLSTKKGPRALEQHQQVCVWMIKSQIVPMCVWWLNPVKPLYIMVKTWVKTHKVWTWLFGLGKLMVNFRLPIRWRRWRLDETAGSSVRLLVSDITLGRCV